MLAGRARGLAAAALISAAGWMGAAAAGDSPAGGGAAVAGGRIALTGAFQRPGAYPYLAGEHLSQAIARAGGLTPAAYPFGAVFTRERLRRDEEEALRRMAGEAEAALSALAVGGRDASRRAAIARLAARLRAAEAVGRIVVEADPTQLRARPGRDTLLAPGDRLFMPIRPNYVIVAGAVHRPGALQFVSGGTAKSYIDRAGGFHATADDGRVFVVLANGEARRIGASLWNFQPIHIPPGSAVIAPRDPNGIDSVPRGLAPAASWSTAVAASALRKTLDGR